MLQNHAETRNRQMRGVWLFSVILFLLMLPPGARAAMKMTPYLQAVTTSSIYVMVECDSTTDATVQYGPTASYGSTATTESYLATTASPVTYVHRVKLTGLSPNTLYHYRASHAGGAWSTDKTFYTAVEPGTPFRFTAYADTRTGVTYHNTIAGRAKNANPRFTLMCGDTCADSSYSSYKNEWFVPNELLLQAVAPTYNATGNHEGWTQNTQAFFQSPASSSGTQAYYSFDYGDVHVVSANTEVTYTVGSAQYNWASGDLSGSAKPWKIVCFHKSAYVCGGHGEDATMIQWSTNLFEPNNVDLVLTGHSHFYQHNLVHGINHYVIGTAGAPFATPCVASYTIPPTVQQYHYAVIDLTPATLHMDIFTDSGAFLDKLDLAKSIAAAKTMSDSTLVDIMGPSIVTHVPSEAGVFYAQDADATSGIRVEMGGTRPAMGAKVLIRGTLGTKTDGERVLQNAIVTNKGVGTTPARGMNNRAVGGAGYVGDTGGASSQGLIVRVWGQVTKAYNDPTLGPVFLLDDGSGVESGEPDGTKGLKVIESGLSPTVGTFLKIAGIVASEKVGGELIRVIRYHETLP